MLKKIIILFLGMVMLSGCIDGFRNYLHRSANNKIIDSKGFRGGKRKPLYNNRYITLAKKNIVENNIDEDDDGYEDDDDGPFASEKINPLTRNRDMYLRMIKRDMERKNKARDGKKGGMSLAAANQKVRVHDTKKEKKLEQEIAQIKAMLREARRDISRCSNVVPAASQNYVPPVTQYGSSSVNNDMNSSYNRKSKVRQKFIREDEDSACAI